MLQVSGYSRFEISGDNYLLLEPATNSLDGSGIAFWSSGGWKKGTINASTLYLNNSSGGNVLIGTTSDNGAKLQVNGSIALTQGASGYATNYISAGGGYSPNSGKYGVKILVCDQSDAQTGLGQDCFGAPYELSLIKICGLYCIFFNYTTRRNNNLKKA